MMVYESSVWKSGRALNATEWTVTLGLRARGHEGVVPGRNLTWTMHEMCACARRLGRDGSSPTHRERVHGAPTQAFARERAREVVALVPPVEMNTDSFHGNVYFCDHCGVPALVLAVQCQHWGTCVSVCEWVSVWVCGCG